MYVVFALIYNVPEQTGGRPPLCAVWLQKKTLWGIVKCRNPTRCRQTRKSKPFQSTSSENIADALCKVRNPTSCSNLHGNGPWQSARRRDAAKTLRNPWTSTRFPETWHNRDLWQSLSWNTRMFKTNRQFFLHNVHCRWPWQHSRQRFPANAFPKAGDNRRCGNHVKHVGPVPTFVLKQGWSWIDTRFRCKPYQA